MDGLAINNLTSREDLEPGQGSLYFQSTEDRVYVNNVEIVHLKQGRSLRLAGKDSTFKDIKVTKSVTETGQHRDVELFGSGLNIEGLDIINTGNGGNINVAFLECEKSSLSKLSSINALKGVQLTSLSRLNYVKIKKRDFETGHDDFMLYSDNGHKNIIFPLA